ncbi:mannan endo-1,4-beta-mannosidase-like [Littorina saxatilis]|uniref:GH26 domain-containing protein n=1 Tax=Littorina saxatilis TaxID=31220 RepID=A0AAN9G6J9_9CAEN
MIHFQWRYLILVNAVWLTSLLPDVTSQPIDTQATVETKALYNMLRSVAQNQSRILVGTHLPTMFGLYGGHPPYWTYEYQGKPQAWMFHPSMAHKDYPDELCDPCLVVNDFPAIAGFDFALVGDSTEDAWVYLMHTAHDRGAVITFCFHSYNLVTNHGPWISGDTGAYHSIRRILPGGDHHRVFEARLDQIADFIKSKVVDKNGVPIPFIFRIWHEQNGNWFWWGYGNQANNTVEDIKQLAQFTVTYLRDHKGLHNILYAISPDCGGSVDAEAVYPGNDYVDIIGTDCYLIPGTRNATYMQYTLDKVVRQAEANGKIAAITETSVAESHLDQMPQFFTQGILHSLTATSGMRMAYVSTWNNHRTSDSDADVFSPYPGHPTAPDYLEFYNDKRTVFLKDLKSNYP